MALLTSYRVGSNELNDGLIFSVPYDGTTFDDHQPVDEHWMYRSGGATPVQTAITLKEAVLSFNVHIIAQTSEQFDARLALLKSLFNPRENKEILFERKLPHESTYKGIMVRAKALTVSRADRKVSITLSCADLSWKNTSTTFQTGKDCTLNSGNSYTTTLAVTYNGAVPALPRIEVMALSASSEGPKPLYYEEVTVYACNPQQMINMPVLLTTGWDCSLQVDTSKMRNDGLDITVSFADGTPIPRYVSGTKFARRVWARPATWPDYGATVRLPGFVTVDATTTTIPIFSSTGNLGSIPTSGKVAIRNEIISYTGVTVTSDDGKSGNLTGCTRGVDGTTAVVHTGYDWHYVRFPTVLRINFGYVNAYAATYFANDLSTWPLINYDNTNSHNSQWVQDTQNTTVVGRGYTPDRALCWQKGLTVPGGSGDYVQSYVSGTPEQGTGKLYLGATKTGAGSFKERLYVPLLPYGTRFCSSVTANVNVSGGNAGQFPTTEVALGVVSKNFLNGYLTGANGTPGTNEEGRYLATFAAGLNQSFTTNLSGAVEQEWGRATHLYLTLTKAPTTNWSSGNYPAALSVNSITYALDTIYNGFPIAKHDTTVRGASDGKYPLHINLRNLSDAQDVSDFTIWPRIAINTVVTYDCEDYSISGGGALLGDSTYDKPIWLRLLPGVNTIRISAQSGIGVFNVTLKWEESV